MTAFNNNRTPGQLWYDAKRQDPRWQKVKAETLTRANFQCEDCGDRTNRLDVHHRTYARGRDIWDYPPENFVCVCLNCHKLREELVELSRTVFQNINPVTATRFLQILMACSTPMDAMVGELALYVALATQAHRDRGIQDA